MSILIVAAESRKGISPIRSHRTVLETLASYAWGFKYKTVAFNWVKISNK